MNKEYFYKLKIGMKIYYNGKEEIVNALLGQGWGYYEKDYSKRV